MTPRPALFLDRDGVLIEERHYLADADDVELIRAAAPAVARANRLGIPVVVVTNQSGVARGLFPESRVAEVHARLSQLLGLHDAHVDRFYYCPHHPTEGTGRYRAHCSCRKPAPGMLLRAAAELDLDLGRSYLVGDKVSDLEAGAAAGCRTILVRTGHGRRQVLPLSPATLNLAYVAGTLAEAIDHCLPFLPADCFPAWTEPKP